MCAVEDGVLNEATRNPSFPCLERELQNLSSEINYFDKAQECYNDSFIQYRGNTASVNSILDMDAALLED